MKVLSAAHMGYNQRVAWDMNKLLPWNMTHKKKSKSGRWLGLLATLPKHLSAGDLHRKCPNSTNGHCPPIQLQDLGSPKMSHIPSPGKATLPHKWACFALYFDGHLLCCGKQTDILVVDPKHLQMLSLPKTHWCKYFEWCNFGDRLLQSGFSIKRRLLEERCWTLSAFMSYAR